MSWADLPFRLKAYISFLASLALPIVIWAMWKLVIEDYDSRWLILLALALLTLFWFLHLPHFKAAITVGDSYIMAIAMMYDVAPCVIGNFVYILIIAIVSQKKKGKVFAHRVIFNVASTTLGAWIYSSLYRAIEPTSSNSTDIVIPAAVLTLSFFLFNSISTSIAIAVSTGESIFKFWSKTCVPLSMDYSLSGVCAAVMEALNRSIGPSAPFVLAPVIGLAWGWNQIHKSRVAEAQEYAKEQEQLYMRTVESLALAVDAKDQTTYGHIRRVKVYAMGLARLCGIKDQNELKAIETGSLLHDIGKIAIDDHILNKPGRLSTKEFEKIKIHSSAGDEILQQVRFPYPVAKYVRYHHERWDGCGYPDGLKGEEIPLGARILAIADAFDAIRFSRPYKLPIGKDEAAEILRNQAGSAYDPALVEIFTNHIDELEQTALRESENAPQLSFRKGAEEAETQKQLVTNTTFIDINAEIIQLSELWSTIAERLPLSDALSVITQKLKQLVPFATCVFYVFDDNNLLTAVSAHGLSSDALQNRTLEVGKGISGWSVAHRYPMINTDPSLDFIGITGDFSQLKDTLVTPIIRRDQCVGTISLYSQQSMSFNAANLEVMRMVADILAPAFAERIKDIPMENILDSVTRLNRFPYLAAVGPQMISFASENRTTISLLYMEITNFQQITSCYGSYLTNSALKEIGDAIKMELRETDILVSYGLKAFVAFLPGLREDQARRRVQRIKQQLNSAELGFRGIAFEYSIGASFFPKDGSNVLMLLEAAQSDISREMIRQIPSEKKIVEFYRA